MAQVCPGGIAGLPQGEFNVFDVDSDDRLVPQVPSQYAFVKELQALGVNGVRALFREKKSR
jgi:hypothetical protein